MSSHPKASTVPATAAATSASTVTLAAIAIARPPSAPILSLGAWAASARRSTTATAAPSRAKSSAAARPMPEPAPLIRATLPSSFPVMTCSLPLAVSQSCPAAVDHQGVTGHIGEPVGGEQDDGVGDLVRHG